MTIDFDKLIAQLGSIMLETGDELSVEALRRIACDAHVFPAVLRGNSEPLDIGRASRTVPPAIRRALLLRDRGCAFPGCDRPARWCHAHHIRHWSAGGPTAVGNLVLLCGHHHRVIHHTEWDVAIVNGRATFYPPAWADPQRRPMVNQIHHLDDHLDVVSEQVVSGGDLEADVAAGEGE